MIMSEITKKKIYPKNNDYMGRKMNHNNQILKK